MVGYQTSWSAFELIKTSDHVFFYQGKVEGGDGVSNGSFRASPLGGDAVFCGPQVHAVEDKTLLSPATSPTAVIDYGNMEGGDKNWYISESGNYRIVFDLKNARVSISRGLQRGTSRDYSQHIRCGRCDCRRLDSSLWHSFDSG